MEDLNDCPMSATLTASCVYPVSGIYTRFQRILFYVVVVVVFFFRFHKWILAAGAAWLAAYTVPAVIHAIALSVTAKSGVDADILAVNIICHAGFFAGFTFAMWPSKHFRRASSPILIFWTVLLLCAKFFTFAGSETWHSSRLFIEIDLGCGLPDPNQGDMAAACTTACVTTESNGNVMFHTAADELIPDTCRVLGTPTMRQEHRDGVFEPSPPTVSDPDRRQDNDGIFPLAPAEIALNVAIALILTSTTLSTELPPRICRHWIYRRLTSSDPPRRRLKTPRYILCVAITILSYVWQMLLFVAFPLMAVDLLVHFIYMKATKGRGATGVWRLRIPKNKPADTPSKAKSGFAMTVAMAWYVWVAVGKFAFPAFALFAIYGLELDNNYLPEQEEPVAVGQWSTWVGVGLALLLAAYARLQPGRIAGAFDQQHGGQHDSILLNEIDARRVTEERMQYLVTRDPPKSETLVEGPNQGIVAG
ncbi:hypothetical protein NEMBOFW57_010736 [Staphylotrichum longicolle]|uniref:Uncharacterized protein n=1 Tax=Staphylotrichum longicolle TaxID=669026 RepID=A0AAD4ES47_9PEZI|nr:hypothetical protein NEMBOFW57_010736 [Staphylotrichum longicolle]